MKENNQKPKEILELEAFYNIEFIEIDNLEILKNSHFNNIYKVNNDNQVTHLKITNHLINKIANLENFNFLTSLDLSNNKISKIENLEGLKQLNQLNLSYNEIEKIENLDALNQLTIVELSVNKISKIENLQNLNWLNKLILYKNKIPKIENLDTLNELRVFELSENKISKIENLQNLKNLRRLYLSYNSIKKIENLQNLKNLITLNLNHNRIEKIENLKNLKNLKEIELSENKISKIENLENLENIEILHLNTNLISEIKNIEKIKNLRFISLNENFLEKKHNIQLEVFDNHLSIALKIIKEEKQKKETIKLPTKVLLLGNHASGKSSFLHYLIHQKLKEFTTTDSTHILTIQEYFDDQKQLLANFYDFGGQDYYHGIYKAFLTNDSINLLFWSQHSNKNQTHAADSNDIGTIHFNKNYWLYQLNYFYSKNKNSTTQEETEPILLVQTRADQPNEIRDTTNENTQELNIKNEFFISLSQQAVHKSKKLQVSLQYLKEEVLEQITAKAKEEEKPKYEIELINYINKYKRDDTREEPEAKSLADLFPYYPAPEEVQKSFLITTLDQLCKKGIVLYYPNHNKLKNLVWLNPVTVVQFIHEHILTTKIILDNKGKVPKIEFEKLFKGFKELIDVLLINKVIFLDTTDSKQPTYIIPGYLPLADTDEYHHFLFHDLQNPNLILKFEHFIPFGFMNRLICFYGGNPEKKLYWKDQLLFTITSEDKKEKGKALIQLNFEALTISISIKGMELHTDTNKILKEIYFDVIALYWDEEIVDYNIFHNNKEHQKNNKEHRIKYLIKEKPIPDAYLSVDGKNFVNYNQLHVETSSFITAYQFNKKNGLDLDKTNGKSIPVIQFKHFTFNQHLKNMKKIFISYSKKDLAMVNTFQDHLSALQRDGKVGTWYCTELKPADDWSKEIQQHFDESDIVCFMISPNFMKTDYIFNHEIPKAFEQGKKIIPIILDFCNWQTEKNNLTKYNGLPYTAKPIKDFKNENMAWFAVTECIRLLIDKNMTLENDAIFNSFTSNDQYKHSQLRTIYERIVSGNADI